jgi:putative two-component system response regulator
MRSATQALQTRFISPVEPTSQADIFGEVDPRGHPDNGDGHVLVVDDEISIRELLSHFLGSHGYQCRTADSGESALEAIRNTCFDLVISDIRMPRVTGLQLLHHLQQNHPSLPVIMITAVADLETAVDAMKRGATDYITKPFNLKKVVASVKNALQTRMKRLQEEQIKTRLAELVQSKSYALDSALRSLDHQRDMTLEALVRALDARESETRSHSFRVQSYAIRLARQLDIGPDPLEEIARGALLHDIGKIGISDSILLKPGKLNEDEWCEMRRHPALGYEILRGIEFLDGTTELVLRHHERWDGTGYPDGIKGKAIPFGARIFAVVDSLDAMTSDRPYRKALTYEHARAEIKQLSGILYDPEVVEAFLRISRDEWAGISRLCGEISGP